MSDYFVKSYRREGVRIHCLATDVGGYLVLSGIMAHCDDSNVSAVTLYLRGAALQCFVDSSYFPSFESVHQITEADVSLLTPVAQPDEAFRLEVDRTVKDASSNYLIIDGWSASGLFFDCGSAYLKRFEKIFCNDDLARSIVLNKVTLLLASDHIPEIASSGTEQIGPLGLGAIPTDNISQELQSVRLAYLGDVKDAYRNDSVRQSIEEDTFKLFLEGIEKFQLRQRGAVIELLLRAHPGGGYSFGFYEDICEQCLTGSCIELINASNSRKSLAESLRNVNAIFSLMSTESYKARYRGTHGALLWFDEPGLGFDLARLKYFSQTVSRLMRGNEVVVLRNSEQVSTYLCTVMAAKRPNTMIGKNQIEPSRRILEAIGCTSPCERKLETLK